MAVIPRVTRVANPRRRKNQARRRNLTPKQIKYFGTARQKAALKNRAQRATKKKHSPGRSPGRSGRSNNPALVATLGAVNPKERKDHMASKKHRKHNVSAPGHVRSRNPHRSRKRRARNPFDRAASTAMFMKAAGVLGGVAAAKFIPTLIPASSLGAIGNTTLGRVAVSGASAYGAYVLFKRFSSAQFAEGVLMGGLAQTLSVGLNALMPGFRIGNVPIGLSGNGLGHLQAAQFPVPQNPLLMPPAPAAVSPKVTQMSGLRGVFPAAL